MNSRYAVVGLGAFGRSVARSLSLHGAEVFAIDPERQRVDEVSDQVEAALILDPTDAEAMRSQELSKMDAVIVSMSDDFETTVLVLATLQEIGVERIYVRINSERERRIVDKLGASGSVFPSEESGRDLAQRLLLGGLESAEPVGSEHSLARYSVPQHMVGKTVDELRLREDHNLNLVTILETTKSGSEKCLGVPHPDTKLEAGQQLLVFGRDEHLRDFSRECSG